MLSMTICGLASGSSQGRSAMRFRACDSTSSLKLRRRRRAAALRREKWTLDDLRSRHSTLPYEFAVQIDFRPDRRADLEMRRIDHSKGDVALASRRPNRRGDAADFALAAVVGVQQRIVRRLVAGDVQARPVGGAGLGSSRRSSARRPVKCPLSKSTSQPKPSSSGERSRPVRMVCSAETKSTFGRRNPASMRAMFSACEPMARMPRERPAAINASQTASAASGLHPQLIAQVAGKAGARHHDLCGPQREVADFERLELLDAPQARPP